MNAKDSLLDIFFFLSASANVPNNLRYMKAYTEHAAVNKDSQCLFFFSSVLVLVLCHSFFFCIR